MEKTYEFTKKQIANAFKKWNEDYKNNPEKYGEIIPGCEEKQAEVLIEYLLEQS